MHCLSKAGAMMKTVSRLCWPNCAASASENGCAASDSTAGTVDREPMLLDALCSSLEPNNWAPFRSAIAAC